MRRPDPQRSYAVLVGTSRYQHSALSDLPAVRQNLVGLAEVLTDPTLGDLPAGRCVTLRDESDVRAVFRELRKYSNLAEDTLIVYFAGHGRIGTRNELYLSLTDTDPDELQVSALPYDLVREVFAECRAVNRVLILDCCFSGLAARDMSGGIESALAVTGTYVLTATTATAVALAPPGEKYTAFTGVLLGLLRAGVPGGPEYLTFDTLYPQLVHLTTEQRLPRPQRRTTGLVGQLALTRNSAYGTETTTPPADPHEITTQPNVRPRPRRRWPATAAAVLGVIGIVITAVVFLLDDKTQAGSGETPDELSSSGCPTGTANGSGSGIQRDAMAMWTVDYQKQCASAHINYNPTGSSSGYQELIDGAVDFAGYDSVLTDNDRGKVACEKIMLPTMIRPIAIIYNLEGIDNLQLRPATLAKIFSGEITKWDAQEIQEDNPGLTLPSRTITPVYRADSAATTAAFTSYLAATSLFWKYEPSTSWPSPVGTGAAGPEGMNSEVATSADTIGYVDWPYARDVSIAKLGHSGSSLYRDQFTELSADTATNAVDQFDLADTGGELKVIIDPNVTKPDAYPLVQVSSEIVCTETKRAGARAVLKGFFSYITSPAAQAKLSNLGYAPLPETLRNKVTAKIKTLR